MSERYLSDVQIDTLAEWLVRNGGEYFNELSGYESEVHEGIMSMLDEDLDRVTAKDYARIDALVAGARVTVSLPHLRHDPLTTAEVMELAHRVANGCPGYEFISDRIENMAPHKLDEHDYPRVWNTATSLFRRYVS